MILQGHPRSMIFSQPYLSNGRAVGMVVIHLSVTDVLWLNGAR